MIADGHADEISAVLANRFHTSERIIDLVLVAEGMRHERVAAALKTGIVAAMHSAREAGADVFEDVA